MSGPLPSAGEGWSLCSKILGMLASRQASKCQLFKQEVTFLGHLVSGQGIASDPDKIGVVRNWPAPTCSEQVRSFHGFCSYYWSFVPGFATICHPITQMTAKGAKFTWTEECQEAFEQIIVAHCTAPVLAYPDPYDAGCRCLRGRG